MFKFLKKKAVSEVVENKPQLEEAPIELRPCYEEGYDESSNTVVRLIGKAKSDKAYKVSGIDDIASKNNWKAWIYLFPVIVLIAVFLIYPLINTIFIAFTKNYQYSSGAYEGLTLENFGVILKLTQYESAGGILAYEQFFTQYAIKNTFIIVFVTVPISTALALIISVALNSIKWFQKFLQTVFFLPYVTNGIAVGMVFSVMFANNGVINFLFNPNTEVVWIGMEGGQLEIFGVEIAPLGMIPLCAYIIWSSIPFKILVFLSGLQGIDKQYYQAAQIDACPKWKVLLKITVPLLSPQILYIIITSFIGAFKEYTSVVGLFGGPGTGGKAGDPNMETIVYYIYDKLTTQTSLAAAAAVFLFVIILLFTAIQFGVSKKRVHY